MLADAIAKLRNFLQFSSPHSLFTSIYKRSFANCATFQVAAERIILSKVFSCDLENASRYLCKGL